MELKYFENKEGVYIYKEDSTRQFTFDGVQLQPDINDMFGVLPNPVCFELHDIQVHLKNQDLHPAILEMMKLAKPASSYRR